MEEDLQNLVEEEARIYNIRHRAFFFSKTVVGFVKDQRIERLLFSMFDQLLRSATSIGANLVEGSAGSSDRDFINFHAIALKSANETKYWLCLIRDTMEMPRDCLEAMVREADEISKIIATIIVNVKARKNK